MNPSDLLRPMIPIRSRNLPSGGTWSHEVKWDGIRALLRVHEDGSCSLISRNGRDHTRYFPEVAAASRLLPSDSVIDGEIVVFDEDGKPSFPKVLRRLKTTGATTPAPAACLVAFDALVLSGTSLLDTALSERRRLLQEALAERSLSSSQSLVFSVGHDDGFALFQATRAMGLEGIVCKEKAGRYHPGVRHRTWIKIKHTKQVSAFAYGYVSHEGRQRSLLLHSSEHPFAYMGRVGSAIPRDLWEHVSKQATASMAELPLERQSVARNTPKPAPGESYRFLSEAIAVTIAFAEWTPSLTLRQPVLKDWSP